MFLYGNSKEENSKILSVNKNFPIPLEYVKIVENVGAVKFNERGTHNYDLQNARNGSVRHFKFHSVDNATNGFHVTVKG